MVGYKIYKYSNLLYLWLCVLFYLVLIQTISNIFYPNLISKSNIINEFLPVISGNYWYFTHYFGMYLLLPIINNGILHLKEYELKIVLISIYLIKILLKDLFNPKKDVFGMTNGYSILWLLELYIFGAYLMKYKFKINSNKNIYFYLINILVFFGSSYLCYILYFYKKKDNNFNIFIKLKYVLNLRYNSTAMILQVIPLTLIFINFKYYKFFSNILSFFGPLTFGVYLIHENKIIRRIIIINLFLIL